MKRTILLTVFIMSLSIVLFSFARAEKHVEAKAAVNKETALNTIGANGDPSEMLVDSLYSGLDLDETGLSREALSYAVKGYEHLVQKGVVNNNQFLTVVDFSESSRKKRFFILDMIHHTLVLNTYVAHGKNSGLDEADSFSNELNSEKSSLGFYLTKTTYRGKHGLSLRLSGLEEGFNDNAEARGVVVHGAPYVNAGRVNSGYMGRSQGCPALPQNEYAQVINIIKDGSVMFLYYPSEKYLQNSQILHDLSDALYPSYNS